MNKKMMKNLLILILLSSLSSHSAFATLTVISDLGGESAVRFYEVIQPVHTDDAPVHPNAVPSKISEAMFLPVISHKWSLGHVDKKAINLPGASPLFLVGIDNTSRQWLQQQHAKLRELGATGLVINVNTVEELHQLRQLAPDLTMIPAPADSLGDRLGIYHYPLIITPSEIYQ